MSRASLLVSQRRSTSLFVFVAAVVAAALGLLTAVDPLVALAAFAAMLAVPGAVLRPKLVLYVLIVSIYAEVITIGGVTIGRLGAPIALIATVSQMVNAPARLKEGRLTLTLVGLYATLAVASLAWTVSPSYTLNALGSLAIALVYMAAFAVLVQTPQDLRRVLWAIALSSLTLAVWWIGSYVTGINRFQNSAGDPNFLAAFQVVSMPLVVVLASSAKSSAGRFALYAVTAVIGASVISTLSRGGVLTLFAAVAVLAVIPAPALFRTRTRKVVFFAVAGVGLAVLLARAGSDLTSRFQQTSLNQQSIAGSRGDLWLAAIHGYRQHPVLGLGYGGFKATSFQLLSITPGVNLSFHLDPRLVRGEYVHNAYLGTLAELGPGGLLVFLGILLSIGIGLARTARRARRARDPFTRSVANALAVGLAAFGVSSLFLSSETSRILWMIVGLSLALPGFVPHHGPSEPAQEDLPAEPSTATASGRR